MYNCEKQTLFYKQLFQLASPNNNISKQIIYDKKLKVKLFEKK